ncbi:hypothetical protein GCM10010411_87800 [Actinomadura fulvescens]|uniref:Fibronectin type-III domain-containing protein n=1 Tax=Actinomadura fulvescens TaxID=46160 RepID=A0ABN3QUQ7_9ACTN
MRITQLPEEHVGHRVHGQSTYRRGWNGGEPGGTAVAAATPAEASIEASISTAPAANANRGPNPTYLSGRTVHVTVWSSSGCKRSTQYTGVLQRKRWYGWQTLTTSKCWGSGAASLSKGCKKGSTYTYRAYMATWPAGNHTYGSQRRFKCR